MCASHLTKTVFNSLNIIIQNLILFKFSNCIGGIMVSVLALSAVDRGFEPGPIKPKIKKSNAKRDVYPRLKNLTR